MSLYRLQDPQAPHLVGQAPTCHRVERVEANPPSRVSVQQIDQQHDLVLVQVTHIMDRAIKLRMWRTASSEASSAQS